MIISEIYYKTVTQDNTLNFQQITTIKVLNQSMELQRFAARGTVGYGSQEHGDTCARPKWVLWCNKTKCETSTAMLSDGIWRGPMF